MPFLLELKTILDWCFTKTALDLDQWLQLAQINFEMFHAKCVNKSYFGKKFGEAIDKVEKWICGCFCLSVILFFLVGPFLMFSNLSFIADENLVTDQSMSFTIKIEDI